MTPPFPGVSIFPLRGLTDASLCPQFPPCDCGSLHELYPHHTGQGHAPGGSDQSCDLHRCDSVPAGGDDRYSAAVEEKVATWEESVGFPLLPSKAPRSIRAARASVVLDVFLNLDSAIG